MFFLKCFDLMILVAQYYVSTIIICFILYYSHAKAFNLHINAVNVVMSYIHLPFFSHFHLKGHKRPRVYSKILVNADRILVFPFPLYIVCTNFLSNYLYVDFLAKTTAIYWHLVLFEMME